MPLLANLHNPGTGHAKDVIETRDRKGEVLQAIRDNEREKEMYKADIHSNEATRKDIQNRVDEVLLVSGSSQNSAFANLISTFRLQVRLGA